MFTLLGQKSLNNAANADTARTEMQIPFFLWTTLLKFSITIRLGVWMAWISLHWRSSARKVWDYFFVIAHLSQWKSASIRNGQLQKGCHFRIVIIKIVTKIIKWNLLIRINFLLWIGCLELLESLRNELTRVGPITVHMYFWPYGHYFWINLKMSTEIYSETFHTKGLIYTHRV